MFPTVVYQNKLVFAVLGLVFSILGNSLKRLESVSPSDVYAESACNLVSVFQIYRLILYLEISF